MQLKAILCRTSTKKHLRNAYYKITPNLGLLFEYQCTSGKFIRSLNRIETFCLNWNALVHIGLPHATGHPLSNERHA